MKRSSIRALSAFIALTALLALMLSGCNLFGGQPESTTENSSNNTGTDSPGATVDYASLLKLDMSSETLKQVVTVKNYVDGDTTHFNVPQNVAEGGVLKARYLAIDTPESTGKIEAYGKKASRFTKEKLSSASSILVESDNGSWNRDSTGSRYLVWVWYKPSDDADYRNLNLEILQNGLAVASATGSNRYGEICLNALNQAKTAKLNVHSGQKDPDMYYGEAVELTLKELRCNIEKYNGVKVAFEGVVTINNNNGVYVEEYDPETGLYYGIYVYYGFGLSGEGLDILSVGNRSRIVGTLQLYETAGTYQISGLTYRAMKPNDPNNIQKISDGHSPAYQEMSAERFANGKIGILAEDETVKEYSVAELSLNSSVSMKNLKVKSVYVTDDKTSSSYGAMTLTCECDGITVTIRTLPFYENNELIGASEYEGKTINVNGIIDYFNGNCQIKVFTKDAITVN